MEIVAGYCESYKPEITVRRQDAGFLYVIAGGAYIYH